MEKNIAQEQAFLSVYFCGKEDCQPGHFFGPAVRPHYLLHVVLSGKGFYQKGEKTYPLEIGDAFLIPPMESTYYQADQEEPWSYAWAGFDGYSCKEILSHTVFSSSPVYKNPAPGRENLLITYMRQLLSSQENSGQRELSTAGNLLLLLSCMENREFQTKEAYAFQYFQKARQYIDRNYSYPVRINDIARHVGIDRTYLYKLFLEQEGISPKQYLLQKRLRAAAQMLCSTSYTITETALSCGFKDAPSFCNYFKKYVGDTPRIFRKNFQQKKEIPHLQNPHQNSEDKELSTFL